LPAFVKEAPKPEIAIADPSPCKSIVPLDWLVRVTPGLNPLLVIKPDVQISVPAVVIDWLSVRLPPLIASVTVELPMVRLLMLRESVNCTTKGLAKAFRVALSLPVGTVAGDQLLPTFQLPPEAFCQVTSGQRRGRTCRLRSLKLPPRRRRHGFVTQA